MLLVVFALLLAIIILVSKFVIGINFALDHALIISAVRSGEPFRYKFGSCWSKGDVKDSAAWFDLVKAQL